MNKARTNGTLNTFLDQNYLWVCSLKIFSSLYLLLLTGQAMQVCASGPVDLHSDRNKRNSKYFLGSKLSLGLFIKNLFQSVSSSFNWPSNAGLRQRPG